jgi:NIMA (never in mitosis gene a)-related kinase
VRLDRQLQDTLQQQRPSSRQSAGRGYKRIKVLGKGQYGGVSLVRRTSDSTLFAMKAVKLKDGSAESQQRAMTEVEIWKQLSHPNIVLLEEAFVGKSGRFLYMVMSYCEAGDLRQLIRKAENAKQKLLDEERVGRIVVQALLALDHVHGRKILHRDLKPENILLESNVCLGGWDVIKLADFGLSRQLEDTNAMAQTGVGTPYYMCPELMQNHEYNASCDIWAIGCVAYELLTLEKPFPGRTMVQVSNSVVNKQPCWPQEKCKRGAQKNSDEKENDEQKDSNDGSAAGAATGEEKHLVHVHSQGMRDLVMAMLIKNQTARPTAEALLSGVAVASNGGAGAGVDTWAGAGAEAGALVKGILDALVKQHRQIGMLLGSVAREAVEQVEKQVERAMTGGSVGHGRSGGGGVESSGEATREASEQQQQRRRRRQQPAQLVRGEELIVSADVNTYVDTGTGGRPPRPSFVQATTTKAAGDGSKARKVSKRPGVGALRMLQEEIGEKEAQTEKEGYKQQEVRGEGESPGPQDQLGGSEQEKGVGLSVLPDSRLCIPQRCDQPNNGNDGFDEGGGNEGQSDAEGGDGDVLPVSDDDDAVELEADASAEFGDMVMEGLAADAGLEVGAIRASASTAVGAAPITKGQEVELSIGLHRLNTLLESVSDAFMLASTCEMKLHSFARRKSVPAVPASPSIAE